MSKELKLNLDYDFRKEIQRLTELGFTWNKIGTNRPILVEEDDGYLWFSAIKTINDKKIAICIDVTSHKPRKIVTHAKLYIYEYDGTPNLHKRIRTLSVSEAIPHLNILIEQGIVEVIANE